MNLTTIKQKPYDKYTKQVFKQIELIRKECRIDKNAVFYLISDKGHHQFFYCNDFVYIANVAMEYDSENHESKIETMYLKELYKVKLLSENPKILKDITFEVKIMNDPRYTFTPDEFLEWINKDEELHMYDTEEKLLKLLKDTYENYSVDFIKDVLADDMTYDSTWILSQITSKQEYLDYLVPKLQVMKEKNTAFNFLMVYQEGQGRPHLIFTPKNQGAFGCFTIEEQDGLIKAIHLEPANFYFPLGHKDKSAFEKFVRHGNLTKEDVIKSLSN